MASARRKRRIALSFDDGPGAATPHILDLLEKYRAVATFFVVGSRVAGREHVLRRMVQLGCEVGNHTYSHPELATLSDDAVEMELARASDVIETVTGIRPRLMRPPFGRDALRAATIARRQGMTTTMYTVSVHDWAAKNPCEITDPILASVRSGGVVLLHDAGPEEADRVPTAEAVERLIPSLQSAGFALVTVYDLITTSSSSRRYVVPHSRGPVRIALSRTRNRLRLR